MSVYCRRSVRFGRSRRRSIGFNMPHATPTASAAYSRERPEVRIGHWPPVGSDAVVVGVIAVAALYVGRMISCRWLWPFCSALCFRRSDRVEAAPVASRPRVVGHTCSGPRRHLRRRQDHRQPVGTSRREPSALPEHDPRIDSIRTGCSCERRHRLCRYVSCASRRSRRDRGKSGCRNCRRGPQTVAANGRPPVRLRKRPLNRMEGRETCWAQFSSLS